MAKLDEIKEHIGALKGYMNIIIALILAIGAGVSKLYLVGNISLLFWIGIFIVIVLIIIFTLLAKNIHMNIKKLKDL
jgi:membrane protein YdbS with pleckstrin-like domain